MAGVPGLHRVEPLALEALEERPRPALLDVRHRDQPARPSAPGPRSRGTSAASCPRTPGAPGRCTGRTRPTRRSPRPAGRWRARRAGRPTAPPFACSSTSSNSSPTPSPCSLVTISRARRTRSARQRSRNVSSSAECGREKIAEDVHLAPGRGGAELAAADDPQTEPLARLDGRRDPRHGVVVGERHRGESRRRARPTTASGDRPPSDAVE